jgi:branched-chain amino acid transport system permease protein
MALPAGKRSYNYLEDTAVFRTRTQKVLLAAVLLLLFFSPMWLTDSWLGTMNLIGITIIAATGLNMIMGYNGQLSFGHAGFIAVGAYTSAILTGKYDQPFFVGLLLAGLVSGALGMVIALPAGKVKGFYMALITIAAQFIIIWGINHWNSMTGGTKGMTVSAMSFGGELKSVSSQFFFIMTVTVLTIFFANNLARTRTGRAFTAIRDNERAAEAIGINLFRYKTLAFFLGCAMAGTAGALLAHTTGFITGNLFDLTQSLLYVGIIIIGGRGTTLGPIAGAIVVTLLTQRLAPFIEGKNVLSPGFALDITTIVIVIAAMLFLFLAPRGLAHYWQSFKCFYRSWPFSNKDDARKRRG